VGNIQLSKLDVLNEICHHLNDFNISRWLKLMQYHDYLKESIEASGLSLGKVSDELKKLGNLTNKSYISKLQNGKIPPSGEEINKALAKVLNCDYDQLAWLAYVEKAPDNIKQKLLSTYEKTSKIEIQSVLTHFLNHQDDYKLAQWYYELPKMRYDDLEFVKSLTEHLQKRDGKS
jgi:transcriptional regulator with XRE-family HTH domain